LCEIFLFASNRPRFHGSKLLYFHFKYQKDGKIKFEHYSYFGFVHNILVLFEVKGWAVWVFWEVLLIAFLQFTRLPNTSIINIIYLLN